jgi:RNA polymerase sigma factor (sigma-70 family)
MRRHGPMVFSVCQSVLRQRDDDEDAFQAAFLILSRKAGSVRRHEGLGGWLQRVAYRVALKARADNLRRQEREAKTARSAVAEPSGDELSWGELRAILHAELAALPESFRAPLVLCYLEGRTQEEAARQLGWPLSTVRGRLQHGREKLRRRLERRGVALTAALGAALTGQTLAEAAIPSSALPSAAAVALARGFLRPVLSMNLIMLSALVTISVVAGGMALRSPVEPRPSESGAGFIVSRETMNQKEAVDAHGDPLPEGAVARLGTVRFNHCDGLHSLLFSPDGRTILSLGSGWLSRWDAATGAELGRFQVIEPYLEDQAVLLPDGKTLISLDQASKGDLVRVWDLTQQKEIRSFMLPFSRREISVYRRNALSRDGRWAAANAPEELRVFDVKTGRELYKLAKGGKEIQDVVFASDRLVTVDTKQTIEVWEAETGKLVRRFANGAPAGFLAASAEGRRLAVLEHHNHQPTERNIDKDAIHIWDLSTGVKKHTLAARPQHRFRTAHFFASGKRLLTSSISPQGKELTVWDVEKGERLRAMNSDVRSSPPAIAITADGSRLAVGDSKGKIELWDLQSGHLLTRDENRHTWAATVFFSPAGNKVHTIGYDSLSSWDARTGKRLDSFDVPRSYDWAAPRPSFSPDGRYVVSFTGLGKESQAILWDIANQRRLHTFSFPSKSDLVYIDAAFSPDSSLLAAWHMGGPRVEKEPPTIRIWDVRTGREIRSFKDEKAGFPGRLFFSADGKTLLVAGWALAGYEVASGKALFSWQIPPVPSHSPGERLTPWRMASLSPQGDVIAAIRTEFVSPAGRIVLYNARTGKVLRRWNDSGKMTFSWSEQLAFSPDGSLLASSDRDIFHLWEVATGKEIRTFRGHRGVIEFLAFSHDDRRLASASWDSTVLIWDATGSPGRLTTDAALEEAWQALTRDDAKRAHDRVWALARTPEKSIPLLRSRLHPVQAVSREELERWIKDLDSDQFAVREKATAELQKLGELAEPALRRILAGKPTLEQRRRIEPILAELETKPPSGKALCSLRAVRVLEYAGTVEARRLLRELAGGAEGARLTPQAQAALTRSNRRVP